MAAEAEASREARAKVIVLSAQPVSDHKKRILRILPCAIFHFLTRANAQWGIHGSL